MNHRQILARAWFYVTQYRALWIFGILVALATSSGSGNGNFSTSGGGAPGGAGMAEDGGGHLFDCQEAGDCTTFEQQVLDFGRQMNEFGEAFEAHIVGYWVIYLVVFVLVIVLLVTAVTVVGYLGRNALIRMVDQHEDTDVKLSWREGFRLGWSREAWRIFLVDLLVNGSLFLIGLVLVAIAAAIIMLGVVTLDNAGLAGVPIIVVGVAFALLVIMLGVITNAVLGPVKRLAYRETALDGQPIVESVRRGVRSIRSNLKDVGIMWLILLGIDLGYGIAMFFVGLLVIIVAAVFGLLFGGIAFAVANLVSGAVGAIIAAFIVGFSVFIVLVAAPLTFVDGLRMVFKSSAWTLTYRELGALAVLRDDAPENSPDDGDSAAAALPA